MVSYISQLDGDNMLDWDPGEFVPSEAGGTARGQIILLLGDQVEDEFVHAKSKEVRAT